MKLLSDDQLWEGARRLAGEERERTCDLVEHLEEIDRRRLHLTRDYSNLFEYCVHFLGYSDPAAYRRIRAARAIRTRPEIAGLLRRGRLSLEAVALLHPFLKDADADRLIREAQGRRIWQVKEMLAGRQKDVAREDSIRMSAPSPVKEEPEAPLFQADAATIETRTPAAEPCVPAPPSPEPPRRSIRYAFTVDQDFHVLVLRAKTVLRHKHPDGRLEKIFREALMALLKKRDKSWRWRIR